MQFKFVYFFPYTITIIFLSATTKCCSLRLWISPFLQSSILLISTKLTPQAPFNNVNTILILKVFFSPYFPIQSHHKLWSKFHAKWKWSISKFHAAAAQWHATVQLQSTVGKTFLLGFATVQDSISAQKPKWSGTGFLAKCQSSGEKRGTLLRLCSAPQLLALHQRLSLKVRDNSCMKLIWTVWRNCIKWR